MSWPRAVAVAEVGPSVKLVGLILSTHSRREGARRVGASPQRLGTECCLPDAAVINALSTLVTSGFLQPLDAQGQPAPFTADTREYRLVEPQRLR